MVATQLHEVVQARRAAVRPVRDVMRVDRASVGAAGEPATAIAARERTAERGRHGAGLAADAERAAVPLDQRHDRRVACQPARRLRRERSAVLELAATAVRRPRERVGVHVQHDLVPIAAASVRSVREHRVRHQHERVGALLRHGGRFRGSVLRLRGGARLRGDWLRSRFRGSAFVRPTALRAQPFGARLERGEDDRPLLGAAAARAGAASRRRRAPTSHDARAARRPRRARPPRRPGTRARGARAAQRSRAPPASAGRPPTRRSPPATSARTFE